MNREPRDASLPPSIWVPSLYLAQGLPYVIVMTVSVIFYKRTGVSNTDIALYTSWLYLPWVIKPLWSPLVEVFSTKRRWAVITQTAIAGGLGFLAITTPLPHYLLLTLLGFWILAFASATNDVATDGFYMLALDERRQAAFVGVRSTFYRVAMVAGQGLLVVVAGRLEQRTGDVPRAWALTFGVAALAYLLLASLHAVALPAPAADRPSGGSGGREALLEVFRSFFRQKGLAATLAFLLLYRFGEAQLIKMVAPFLLDGREQGGLGLTTGDVGLAYGTIGVVALTCGGLLGGYLVSRVGLGRLLWVMVSAIHLPDAVFVYLSHAQPSNLTVITAAIAVEQFGYGFGFTAFLLYMIMVSAGPHRTAHYAICTGFMALGMMIPGMWSGWLQEQVGYRWFFIWVMLATVPGFLVAAWVRIEPEWGRRPGEG